MASLPYVDFHSHFLSPNAIYCTATPEAINPKPKALLYCQGLLPQYWKYQHLTMLLKNLQSSNVQLGEVGLDKRFQSFISLQKQEENLLTLLQYAKDKGKIVTLHSVQATERTIKILKTVKLEPWKTIWHGFTGSKETAQDLFRQGIIISVGLKGAGKLGELSKVHSRFVLETDYEGADQTQYNALLEAHYQSCARELGWTVEDLKEHCFGQAQTLTN
jgi:Tat protein secretion system quality control protein TatD with DNase activity